MPPNASRLPPPGASKSKVELSGSIAADGKPNVNFVSAQGEIASPKNPASSRRPSNPSPSPMGTTSFSGIGTTSFSAKRHAGINQHPLYEKVQELDSDLQPFLEHDWETNPEYKLTKLKIYNILYYFNPNTTARPSDKKPLLTAKFKEELLPQSLPFCKPAPPPPESDMDTDDGVDFDPLHQRTTIPMLASTIHKFHPHVAVSSKALKDEVLALYKFYVNPNLTLPHNSDFTHRPRVVKSHFVPKLGIQVIRHTLQAYHPEVFLNYPVLRLANYISLYRLFLLEETQNKQGEEMLVPGYHYWINVDLLDDEDSKAGPSKQNKA